ncbi:MULTISPECIES: hypothetical protein [Acidithrix]|uniref:hypothetical protein n=1 Tax=Acidithrix TaxID=1609233 RepID=UPI00126A613B|nr:MULTISPECIES: hypothetical protein [Acidithrix]
MSYVVDPSPSPQGAKVLCLTSLLKSHHSQLLIETMLAIEALQKLKDLTPLQHLPTALKYRSRTSNNRENNYQNLDGYKAKSKAIAAIDSKVHIY